MRSALPLALLATVAIGCARSTPSVPEPPQDQPVLAYPGPGQLSFGIPSYGNGLTMYVDPQNASTCASNSNDCVHSSCSGTQGPCANTYGLYNKWQGYEPRFNTTTMTWVDFLSAGAVGDSFVFRPHVQGNANVGVKCDSRGTAIGSGTLTVSQAKNALSNLDERLTFSGVTPTGIGNLVVNTTRGSQAWIAYVPSAGVYAMTEPLASASPPLNNTCGFLAEDESWTTGNSVTIYPAGGCNVNVAEVSPTFEQTSDAGSTAGVGANQVVLWRIGFADPSNNASPTNIGRGVQILESYVPTANYATLHVSDPQNASPYGGIINTFLGGKLATVDVGSGSIINANSNGNTYCLYAGGVVGNTTAQLNVHSSNYGALLDANFEYSGSIGDLALTGFIKIGEITSENNADLWLQGHTFWKTWPDYGAGADGNGPLVWGSKAIVDEPPEAKIVYNSTNGATSTFISGNAATAPIVVNRATGVTPGTACSTCGSTMTCGIPLTGVNLDNTCGDAGFGGYASIPGGGAVIAYGSPYITQ
jgi:hypothetical protein